MFQFCQFREASVFVLQKAIEVGFAKSNLHAKKIEEQRKNVSHKKPHILDRDRYRYNNFPSYRATHCHNYNANEVVENIWIGEGPSSDESYDNIARFCHSILKNEKIKFNIVVAIGPSYDIKRDKYSFINYLRPDRSSTITKADYQFTTIPIDTEQADHHLYEIQLYRKKIHKKNLALVHLPEMQDMGTLRTSDQLIHQLILLANKSINEPVFIHCSAGLGRSGTIALALTLFRRHQELSKITNKRELANAVFKLWDQFNQIRPGTIQNQKQLANALELADKMYAFAGYVLVDEKKLKKTFSISESSQQKTSSYSSNSDPFKAAFFPTSSRSSSNEDFSQNPETVQLKKNRK